ncbi:MAG TPA: nuclease-related domain-containing protein [Nocardioidaceae bacterium]|nr:nuclease-related domain-containing protein [Nocardioidaceae bacterium]
MNDDIKQMRLRYRGACALCGATVEAGSSAGYDRAARRVICLTCLPLAQDLPIDPGTPGGSLEREYERRRKGREERVRGRFPRAGGLLLALTGEPEATKAFARGAEGERRLAARLEQLCGEEVLFLHNRRRGRSSRSGDIDHIAVAASGVYVVDAKNYKDAKVSVRRTGGLLRPVREQLIVRGRDKTHLAGSLNKQYVAVVDAMEEDPAPVTALFCFVDAELPVFQTLKVGGVPVLTPRKTAMLLRRPGPYDEERRRAIWKSLARRLPPA